MVGPPKLAIVIPTLHEAGSIGEVLDRLRRSADELEIPYELIVVDDDSGDGIEAIVSRMSERDRRIRLSLRKGARGLTGAVIHGWQNTDAELLGVIDGDLQHPPELLPAMWHALQAGADVVIGSRYVEHGSRPKWNVLRRAISRLAVWMTRPLQKASVRVTDPMSGFFLVRRLCIQDVHFHPQGFKILLDILVQGNVRSVSEIPFIFGRRRAGSSKASPRVAIQYCKQLANLWREHRRPWSSQTVSRSR